MQKSFLQSKTVMAAPSIDHPHSREIYQVGPLLIFDKFESLRHV